MKCREIQVVVDFTSTDRDDLLIYAKGKEIRGYRISSGVLFKMVRHRIAPPKSGDRVRLWLKNATDVDEFELVSPNETLPEHLEDFMEAVCA